MTAATDAPLRIIEFQAENVKRIKAVSIRPEGNTVVLSGKNKQGKTSILDAIWLALGGGKAKTGTEVSSPIREGETEAFVKLDLGDLIVTRRWSYDAAGDVVTELALDTPMGSLSAPQGKLDALMSHAGFDPTGFVNLKDTEQVAELSKFVKLPFDPVEFDSITKRIFDQRTEVDRDVKRMAAQVEGMPRYPNAPAEPVDAAAIIAELDAAHALENEHNDALEKMRDMARKLLASKDRLDEAERVLAAAKLDFANYSQWTDEATAAYEKYEGIDQPDTDAIKERLANVGRTNEEIGANRRYEHAKKELAGEQARVEGLTAQIDQRRADKKKALETAEFPYPELGFEDGHVTYKGQPFRQASGAEQVEVSMAIAMALNPKIKVITIRDASLLDEDSLATIEREADKHGYQLWLERVGGDDGFVIVDGGVAA